MPGNSELGKIVENYADNHIEIEKTDQGLRHNSEEFEQFAYSKGSSKQTTFSFWNEKSSDKVRAKARTV